VATWSILGTDDDDVDVEIEARILAAEETLATTYAASSAE
jgi:hypothetical protein